MKVLYIGRRIVGLPKDGGTYVSMKNRKMLLDLYGKTNVVIYEVAKIPAYRHLINIVLRKGYGETASVYRSLKRLSEEKFDFVFVDGTNYGTYIAYFSKIGHNVIAFCHNVEHDYYNIKYQAQKSISNLLMRNYIYNNEKLAVKYANIVIALNNRDAAGIKKYYGKCPDLLLPIFYTPIPVQKLRISVAANNYILFVGAGQIVNVEGITWFIKKVSPFLKCTLVVVGTSCNAIMKWFSQDKYPNVVLRGFVDDLEELYINASAVICPIFSGSGMKTKTIEALRYGKTIFGTTEAFEGIEVDFERIGGLCNTVGEYIESLSKVERIFFNEYSYRIFMEHYSDNAVELKFEQYVNSKYAE